MRVYSAELIYNTGVLGFQTFKLVFCMHNKLHSHAKILSLWAFDVTFPWTQPSEFQSVSFEHEKWAGLWNPKLTPKDKIDTFKIWRKKGSDLF